MGIRIYDTSKEFTEIEQYLMTKSPAIVSMKDVEDGTSIIVDGVLNFEDEKDNGEVVDIMSIITPDSKVYSCQSKTFKRSIIDISNIMHGKPFPIKKISGKTKAGRDYIDCILDTDALKAM